MGWGEVDRDKENQEQLDKHYGIDRPKEQREALESHYQTFRSEDPRQSPPGKWTQRELERREKASRNANRQSITRDTSGSVMPQVALLFVLLAIGVLAFQRMAGGAIDANLAGHESTQHFLHNWLALAVQVFMPITFLIMLLTVLARCFWRGVKFVIAAGLFSVVGTFFYLVIAGVFFGK